MTLDPNLKQQMIKKPIIKKESKLTKENYEKLRKLTGSGFSRIYKNKTLISNS